MTGSFKKLRIKITFVVFDRTIFVERRRRGCLKNLTTEPFHVIKGKENLVINILSRDRKVEKNGLPRILVVRLVKSLCLTQLQPTISISKLPLVR